ncbi:hypothetical protein [Microaceticoccus formicicus]|uniref:hypothetical protein n=1 Tax=Microaceticoccus formicicus TaxID=3118105 RepID=UPI003CD04E98|nr:hypothetical protein VZL98_09665 [Peptoniphilaceae bacterium AMB_02]
MEHEDVIEPEEPTVKENPDPNTINDKGALFKIVETDEDIANQEIKLNDNNPPEEPPELMVKYYDETAGMMAVAAKDTWAGATYDRMSMEQIVLEDKTKSIRIVKDTDIVLQFKDPSTAPSKISIEDSLITATGTDGQGIRGTSFYREAEIREDGVVQFKLGNHPSLMAISSTELHAPGKEFRVIKIHASWGEGSEVEYGFGVYTDPDGWKTFFGEDYKRMEEQLAKVKEKYKSGEYTEYLGHDGSFLVDLNGKTPDDIEKNLFISQLKDTQKRENITSIGTWIALTHEGDPIYNSMMIKGFRIYGISDNSEDKNGLFFGLQREFDDDYENISKKLTGFEILK